MTATSSSEISLTWPDVDNESGYEIERSSASNGHYILLARLSSDVTSYIDGGLTPTTQYCYRLRSFKTTGRKTTYSAYSPVTCATTTLERPVGVRAIPESSTVVAISWSISGGTAEGFRVERSTANAGPWELASTTTGTARSFHDLGRSSETQVCYRVIGLSSSSETAPSDVSCTAPPAGPTNLAAAAVSSAITLSWQDHSALEDGYQLQRATDGVNFSILATLPPNSVSYRDAAIVVATTYAYRVAATKDGGRSDLSNVVTVTVPSPQTDPPIDAPTQVAAAPLNSSTIRVAWMDNTTTESGFRVEQSISTSGPWATSGTTAANVTGLTLTAPMDQRLCYRVVAFNTNGDSPPSTADCTGAPAPPTNLAATAATDGIDVSWSDNSGLEFGYVLEISTDGSSFQLFERLSAGTTRYHHIGVNSATTYWYRVYATRDGGKSDLSNVAASAGACVVASEAEVCDNGVDDNCDGMLDGVDPACDGQIGHCWDICGSGSVCGGEPFYQCVSSCGDGWRDSDESDIDCGGGCGPCQVDQSCWGDYDCASNNCVYTPGAYQGVCQPATGANTQRSIPTKSTRKPAIRRPPSHPLRRP